MYSAFGVDHGEVSKRGPIRVPGRSSRFRRPTRAQKRTQGVPGARSGPQKVGDALNRMGEADISIKGVGRGASKGVKGIGGVFERRPGLTGATLVGGAGALGYSTLREKKK